MIRETSMSNIKTEVNGPVGIATLNRPDALNALNTALLDELADALEAWDRGTEVRCMIVTGSERAFAAGADIKEMAPKSFSQMYRENLFADQFDRIARIRKPVIAAVAGHALGGGCELALVCDFVIAADTAKFGQPEITLGVMPGLGGSQRLTRIIGKSKAMDMCLTGRVMDAAEAEASGLAARVVPAGMLMAEALKAAQKIAAQSSPTAQMVKEAVNRAYETSLAEGLHFERRLFHAMFATHDQKEGMAAFSEKRKPGFKDE
jgi:enoyl-CoA hydratase